MCIRDRYIDCDCIIAGDFNADIINSVDDVAAYINSFISAHALSRCDESSLYCGQPTYINFALNCMNCIDFILTSNKRKTSHFKILDRDLNFSDHLPITVSITCAVAGHDRPTTKTTYKNSSNQLCLRWDKADINSYYSYTRQRLQNTLLEFDNAIKLCETTSPDIVSILYNEIISILNSGASLYVPTCQKIFTSFGGTRSSTH